MLKRDENELLTQTGPGTPMGLLMRRYWVPAALSSELPTPDCPPIRVKLLSEKVVAFRDTQGRVGLVDEFCAHRRASLFLGRNEEGGLRCVYHGWKYDVDGNCLDMPNENAETNFKHKIHLKAYPTVEIGGVVWAYMGPKEKMPPPPKFKWAQAPDSNRYITKVWLECNWLQAMEGGFDTVHTAFLHRNLTTATTRVGISPGSGIRMSSSSSPNLPRQEVNLTDYGLSHVTIFSLRDKQNHIAITPFVMPFHQVRTTTSRGEVRKSMMEGHMWVPMDDENCMDYTWLYSSGDEPMSEMKEVEHERGRGIGEVTTNFRKLRNKDNNWLVDRQVQKTENYTGIEGINTQDHAVQESMGPIIDRTQEHLGSSDKVAIAIRRLLIQTVKMMQEGADPLGTSPNYGTIQPAVKVLPSDVPWRDALMGE